MPGILRRIVAPTFPARDFDITSYGARGDGTTDCAAAFHSAVGACNAAGGGRVNEDGAPVATRIFADESCLRPQLIQTYRCRNVLIEDVRIVNSPMWEIHPVLSTNVTVRRVKIRSHGPNNDGCDPESCRDVLIEGCEFDTGDDCIAMRRRPVGIRRALHDGQSEPRSRAQAQHQRDA